MLHRVVSWEVTDVSEVVSADYEAARTLKCQFLQDCTAQHPRSQ
jgi:hypothetical protein